MHEADEALRRGFGHWLRQRMAAAGVSEGRLGAAIGMPYGWLARFEAGERTGDQLTWTQAWRLIAYLGADPTAVMSSFLDQLVQDALPQSQPNGSSRRAR